MSGWLISLFASAISSAWVIALIKYFELRKKKKEEKIKRAVNRLLDNHADCVSDYTRIKVGRNIVYYPPKW